MTFVNPMQRFAPLALSFARLALGSAFLTAVADRFGLLGRYDGWGNFASFMAYTAQVNSFMPAATIPFLAWSATIAETVFGIALVVCAFLPAQVVNASPLPRWVALGSSVLLLLFGIAMMVGLEWKKPFDYSVFSASACALLLAIYS
ncbi:DoxX protein [Edaphobacter flagellatus]|uniref:DoxX protein n=1 Tax=Edaphobacter flagellatus TaxID=1933044 RepID=UPI0021B37331|nr:DoxX protein [Edaphobacter flagellatus]